MSPSDSCCFSQAQANLLLSQGLSFDPSKPTFPALLEEVVGFFLVEHHVLQTSPPGWRAEQEVDDLWDNMCERAVDFGEWGAQSGCDPEVPLTHCLLPAIRLIFMFRMTQCVIARNGHNLYATGHSGKRR